MSFSDSVLEARFAALETAVSSLVTVANNLATRRQVNNSIALIQEQVDSLNEVDETQYETQLQAIIDTINDLQTSLNNVATKRELNNILALLRAEVASLQQEIITIETTA